MICYAKKRIFFTKDGVSSCVDVPCGKCLPCLLAYSSQWSLRCDLERSLWEKCCCVTLTYSNDKLGDRSLCKRDYQLFLKRLRKVFPHFRYFGCGEYGAKRGRKHFHIILFGIDFDDKRFFKYSKKRGKIFTSKVLSSLWSYGWATIGDVNENTALYTAKYLTKLKPLEEGLLPPFCFMSLKPSIGLSAVSVDDLEKGYVYIRGVKRMLPRSFYLSYERKGIVFPECREKRMQSAIDVNSVEYDVKSQYSLKKSEETIDNLFNF